MSEERCVCCGRIIPEGIMVCPVCEEDVKAGGPYELPKMERLNDVSSTLKRWYAYLTDKKKMKAHDPAYEKLAIIFTSAIKRMAEVIDQALSDGDQMSFLDQFSSK